MANVNSPARVRERLEEQLRQIQWLRGTGPNPIDYDKWDERTLELLVAIYGDESEEVRQYQESVGKRGRLAGVRGPAEDMTLNIHGQWGILGRLERAEALLRGFRDAINP